MSSVNKRPSGKWRAVYQDETKREHTRHFDRRADAQRWLDEINASQVTGQYVDPGAGKQTFHDFYLVWAQRQLWATGTRRAMDLSARSTTFADVPLRSIRRSHIEQWVKSMDSDGSARGRRLAPGTIHTRFNNARSVLRGAVADRMIARDPSIGVTLPRRRRADAAMTIPTTDAVGALLDKADEPFLPYVALCAFAGLRLGEAAAVQIGDVDFLRRQLRVTRQVQRENGGGVEIKPPKYGSERTVHLPDELVTILARHIGTYLPEGKSKSWLFVGEAADPPHQNTIGHRWRTTLKAAGLSGVRLHDLRHFYASGLIAAGCDVVTVQRALGHSSANTTLSTYAHLWPTAEDRTRAAASAMLAAALAATDSSRTAGALNGL